MLSQMGYLVIICLSYNILLGQGGMLSFGHAVYAGLGSFIAVHAMNVGGRAARAAAAGDWFRWSAASPACSSRSLFGYVTTKKSGTTFAMITLGIGELVAAMSLMFPGFFGGEGGVTTNRVYGKPFLGLTFGPQIQVYYLVAAYCFVSHRADVRVHADAARPDAQRRARQPRAGRVHRLQHAAGALPRLHHRRLLRRHRRRPGGASTSRSSTPPTRSARCAPAATCCSPSSAAPPSSSGR